MSRQVVRFALLALSLAIAAPGGASPLPGGPAEHLAAWWYRLAGGLTGGLAGTPTGTASGAAGRQPGPRSGAAPAAAARPHPAHRGSGPIRDEGFGVDPNGKIDAGGPH
jgi:hypothetical protein